MSKIIYICLRNEKDKDDFEKGLRSALSKLTPDNITPRKPYIHNDLGILIGIYNPDSNQNTRGASGYVGHLIGNADNWWKPFSEIPDGSYAIFRGDENHVELVSDVVASRTIWYAKTEDLFIASTSQRAIIYFLKSFHPDPETYSWMISSGTLGPGFSWDKRIKALKGNAQLIFDRVKWNISYNEKKEDFNPLKLTDCEHEARYRQALEDVFVKPHLDFNKWRLPLSGGYDSRTIFLMLKKKKGLKCITWGLKSSFGDPLNDGYISKLLTNQFGVDHQIFTTDISSEPMDKILKRFLIAGEGRVDHLPGYADGFKLWKTLFENGIYGIIRGDHSCGDPLNNFLNFNPRRHSAARMLSDFFILNNFSKKFGFKNQVWPEYLCKKQTETKYAWYVRLYQQFQIHYILSALNDLKCSYVEIFAPLLTRRIVETVRHLPDQMRINKRLRKKILTSMNRPEIPFNKRTALAVPKDLLRDKRLTEEIRKELNSPHSKELLTEKYINYILSQIEVGGGQSRALRLFSIKAVSGILDKLFKSSITSSLLKERIDMNVVAFRTYIICRMHRILTQDAADFEKILSA